MDMNEIYVSKEQSRKIQELELQALIEVDRICRKHGINYTLTCGSLLGAVRHGGFIPWDDDIDIAMMRNDLIKFEEVCKTELDHKYFYQSHHTEQDYFRLYSKLRINNTIFKESVHSNHNINHGIYIDIFTIDYTPNNKLKKALHILLYKIFSYGLSAKYLNIQARSGKKKMMACFLRLVYLPFTKEFLYRNADKIAMRYKDTNDKLDTIIFSGPYLEKECFEYGMFTQYCDIQFEENDVMIISNYKEYLESVYGDYMKLPPKEKQVSHHNITELKLI